MLSRWGRRALLLGALFGVIAGCKPEPAATTPTGGGGEKTAGGGAGAKKYRFAFIPKNTGNPYFDVIVNGLKESQAELGFEFNTVAPATAEATSQIPFIKQQVQQGVDAIIISPNSPDAIKPALKEAMAKGVRVIAINSDLPGNQDGREVALLPMDFTITGRSQIELMSELIGGKGEIAILSATTDAPDQNTWIAGMKETLKDSKYRDVKLVDIAYGNDDPQKSLTETQALLTKHPNLRGIISPTTVGVAAAAQAVETAGAAKRVQVTGLGTPNQMRRFIENGTVTKFALWDPAEEGYLVGYLAVGMLNGTIKPAPGVTFKAGRLGERKFLDHNVVISGDPLVFDKSNIEKYHF